MLARLCFSWLQLVGSDIYVKNKCGYGILNWLYYNSYQITNLKLANILIYMYVSCFLNIITDVLFV